ncbi:GCN5 family acetyltransferase [Sorangium cellulosum]|uniref:GCN5 family acetyltransferase n=1 Tax=Sorangium cellulosum TaxID=56 RepID=A0A4P2Q289_SORCE|nr:GNAT family N-acetyltransferase [Sorangium cellulosum]AUX23374.1 GCN5 family acetyltransferase [Sorangium cellulosum]
MLGSQVDSADIEIAWVEEIDARFAGEIRALFNAVLETEDVIGFPGPLRGGEAEPFFEGVRLDVRLGRKRALVVRSCGELVAMVLLSQNGQPNCRHLGEVSKCMIHPRHRGRGILEAGLRALCARCHELGIEVLTLDVRKGTRAEGLWRRLGFSPFGELPDYARVGGRTEAGVFMWAPVARLAANPSHR